MKVGVYNEPSGGALGGCESAVAWVASTAVSLGHSAEIVHHQPWLQRSALAQFAGTNLDTVDLRYVPARPELCGSSWMPTKRFREARLEGREVSAGYDCFFCFAHGVPPFNHSPRGILSILFPLVDVVGHGAESASLRQRARASYTGWEWERRMASYQSHTAISKFSADWSRARWGLDPTVLYPPVNVEFPIVAKRRRIVSVGRFTRNGHPKRQDLLVDAFRQLTSGADHDVELLFLGTLSGREDDAEYFSMLRREAEGLPVEFHPNASRSDVVHALASAEVYWHAAGYGQRAERSPERMEHFGISTVEAMAASAVPVVINQGGQAEIVRHGVDGFVWDDPAALVAQTARLLQDGGLRHRMGELARERSRDFSIERFRREVHALLEPPAPASQSIGERERVTL